MAIKYQPFLSKTLRTILYHPAPFSLPSQATTPSGGMPTSYKATTGRMGAGWYKTVRRVLDRNGWYFMATEVLECRSCHRKVAGWSQGILDQLDIAHREEFPAVLTYK